MEACERANASGLDHDERPDDMPRDSDVYSVDVHVTRRLILGGGGPSRWVDIRCTEEGGIVDGELFDNSHGYATNNVGEDVTSHLTGDECETIAAAFGCYWEGIDG